jgi:SNF2 family DNA or RNA helicase
MSTLWSHQREAHDLLKPLTAAGLFMEMGTGKSLVALELLKTWDTKRALIVCPKAVMQVWQSEFAKHTEGWRVVLLDAASVPKKLIQAQQALKNPNGRLALVVNYESLWRDPLGKLFQENPPEVVIADEVHRIKSARGISSRYMARLAPKVRRRLGLTGTPLPHSPLDAYAQYRFLDPRIFGFSYTRFKAKYALMGGFQGYQVLKFINLDDLHQKMYSIAYRVRAEDVLDLPPVLEQTITFELSSKAQKIYDSLEKDLMAEIGSDQVISVPSVLVKLLRLQQLTGGWLTPDEAKRPERVDFGKAEVLKDLLEDMGQEPVVIFARFLGDLDAIRIACDSLNIIRRRLREPEITYCELSGRENTIDQFYKGKAQVIIAQIRAGSLGIDLTRARYCIFWSTGYSLGDLEQARKRVHRPGQTRPVTYYYLAAKKTVDEKIIAALEKRADLVKFIVDDMRRK